MQGKRHISIISCHGPIPCVHILKDMVGLYLMSQMVINHLSFQCSLTIVYEKSTCKQWLVRNLEKMNIQMMNRRHNVFVVLCRNSASTFWKSVSVRIVTHPFELRGMLTSIRRIIKKLRGGFILSDTSLKILHAVWCDEYRCASEECDYSDRTRRDAFMVYFKIKCCGKWLCEHCLIGHILYGESLLSTILCPCSKNKHPLIISGNACDYKSVQKSDQKVDQKSNQKVDQKSNQIHTTTYGSLDAWFELVKNMPVSKCRSITHYQPSRSIRRSTLKMFQF